MLKLRHRKNKKLSNALEPILGFKPKKIHYYERAFTHRSTNKKDEIGNPFNYERLEYVGDAILGAVVAHYLYVSILDANEGYLTKMRSKIVSRSHLNEIGKGLHLISLLDSKLENSKFGDNIHGNLFEALVGAVFLDRGYSMSEKFIFDSVIDPHVDINQLEGKVISYKSLMVEWCQKEKKRIKYTRCHDEGVDEVKHFSVTLEIDGKIIAKARATSRKKAEEKVSQRGYFALQDKIQF
ncbi:putative dsRNA-binding protein [Flavobacteriaceae bacterium]|nr:putative dsRNA-binding protein [Flavobacteriaceae bacterium]